MSYYRAVRYSPSLYTLAPTNHDPKVVAKFYLESLEVAGNTLMLLFN